MIKIKNENNFQITSSKRRSGLFKKASELCTLCEADIAIIVFSPSQKIFSFVDWFLNNNHSPPQQNANMKLNEIRQNSIIQDLNNQLTQTQRKRKNKELKKIRKNSKMPRNCWEEPIERLDLAQAYEFKRKLENLKKTVPLEASKFLQTTVPHQNFYAGSSSKALYWVDGGTNINPDLEQLNQRRMMNINAFYNQNIIIPNPSLPFEIINHGNVTEGSIPDYNMNYRPEQKPEL
ncbi:hypothetical protein EUTSA_v10000432mg [Eutrema salsugineum]|uniref:MADS-box domain-containing protein n=1 Tax=Eutrema salsugineum TaxID=72664 RepID=V4LVT2_EUTSA|nr:hypothetical protein EUTSA_v10000432mg [Eutrema salsugineum]